MWGIIIHIIHRGYRCHFHSIYNWKLLVCMLWKFEAMKQINNGVWISNSLYIRSCLWSVLYITVCPFVLLSFSRFIFVLLPLTASDHLLCIFKPFLCAYYRSSLGGYGTYTYHAYVISDNCCRHDCLALCRNTVLSIILRQYHLFPMNLFILSILLFFHSSQISCRIFSSKMKRI